MPESDGFEVPLGELAPNPLNLRGADLGPGSKRAELVASLRERGVIQALVVADVKPFLEEYPEYKGAFAPEVKYVLLTGHRRLDAAPDAGLTTLKIDVQNRHIPDLTGVFLDENQVRNDLTVFQEAEGFRRLREPRGDKPGLSYEKIAEKRGVSKSHVIKRVQLLDLDDEARALVLDGRLGIDTAVTLLSALGGPQLVVEAARLLEESAASKPRGQRLSPRDAAQQALLNADVPDDPSSDSPPAEDGSGASSSVLAEPADAGTASPGEGGGRSGGGGEPDGVASSGSEGASAGAGPAEVPQPRASATKPVRNGSPAPTEDGPSPAEVSKAAAVRANICLRLVRNFSCAPDPSMVRIAVSAISNAADNAVTRAHAWLVKAEVADASGKTPGEFRAAVLAAGHAEELMRFAFALSLAAPELRAADKRRRGDRTTIEHVKFLAANGYEPMAWELGAATPAAAP
ncbi:ParB/RepB/Spo0J family partition protein [Actinocorallia aurea]